MSKRHLAVLGALVALTATACGSSGTGGTAHSAKGRTLTVWYMDGDLSAKAIAAIDASFERATGAKVKVQIQQWDNINTKISTALAQDDPPDVVEIGNTDVPLFAATGGLTDITAHRKELAAGQHWLPGLVGPATVGGHLYAAPLFAGNRAVIYNKTIWAKAGVTSPPTTYQQLTADLDKIKAAHPDPGFSAFYVPGKYWYGAVQFVWDAGGQIAVRKDGTWQGALASPAALRGLAAWRSFQNRYSTTASRNVQNSAPDQDALFAKGQAATILDSSVNVVLKDNPKLKGHLGTFPMPSMSGHGNQPVFLGGSDIAIPAKSRNRDLALRYLKIASGVEEQKKAIVGIDGWTPDSTELISATRGSLPATSKAFFTAAEHSVATPATPGWATIETDHSIDGFFADIATGRSSVSAAAASFDKHLDQALNASGQ